MHPLLLCVSLPLPACLPVRCFWLGLVVGFDGDITLTGAARLSLSIGLAAWPSLASWEPLWPLTPSHPPNTIPVSFRRQPTRRARCRSAGRSSPSSSPSSSPPLPRLPSPRRAAARARPSIATVRASPPRCLVRSPSGSGRRSDPVPRL